MKLPREETWPTYDGMALEHLGLEGLILRSNIHAVGPPLTEEMVIAAFDALFSRRHPPCGSPGRPHAISAAAASRGNRRVWTMCASCLAPVWLGGVKYGR